LTRIDKLSLITTGQLPPNPAELLGSQRMQAILQMAQEQSDVIVIDTPPTLAVTDASVLAPVVDGVILVVQPGKTHVSAARQTVEQLRRVNANLLGVVLKQPGCAQFPLRLSLSVLPQLFRLSKVLRF